MPAAFLHQQMEWREALDDLRGRGDAGALQALNSTMADERERLLAELQQALDVTHDYPRAAALVRQLMFFEKFAAEIDAAEQYFEAGERRNVGQS